LNATKSTPHAILTALLPAMQQASKVRAAYQDTITSQIKTNNKDEAQFHSACISLQAVLQGLGQHPNSELDLPITAILQLIASGISSRKSSMAMHGLQVCLSLVQVCRLQLLPWALQVCEIVLTALRTLPDVKLMAYKCLGALGAHLGASVAARVVDSLMVDRNLLIAHLGKRGQDNEARLMPLSVVVMKQHHHKGGNSSSASTTNKKHRVDAVLMPAAAAAGAENEEMSAQVAAGALNALEECLLVAGSFPSVRSAEWKLDLVQVLMDLVEGGEDTVRAGACRCLSVLVLEDDDVELRRRVRAVMQLLSRQDLSEAVCKNARICLDGLRFIRGGRERRHPQVLGREEENGGEQQVDDHAGQEQVEEVVEVEEEDEVVVVVYPPPSSQVSNHLHDDDDDDDDDDDIPDIVVS
jgi:hypothetical protein